MPMPAWPRWNRGNGKGSERTKLAKRDATRCGHVVWLLDRGRRVFRESQVADPGQHIEHYRHCCQQIPAQPPFPRCHRYRMMSKREARNFAAAGVDVDAPRAKRRREGPATSNPVSDGKHNAETTGANKDSKESADNGTTLVEEDKETVSEKGLQLWTTLKDAVNKECVIYLPCIPHLTSDPRLSLPYRPPSCPRARSYRVSQPQGPNRLLPVHATSFETTISGLLRLDQTSHSS